MFERQIQDEQIRLRCRAEEAQTSHRDGHHDQTREQHIEWEHPSGRIKILLPLTLDHGDMELARQADNGRRRQKRHGQESFRHGKAVKGLCGQFTIRQAPLHQKEHRQDRNSHQCGELEHGLQRQHAHQAGIVPRGVRLSRAEQDGKNRQHNSGQQNCFIGRCVDRAVCAICQCLKAHADGFQLQCNIGQTSCDGGQRCSGSNRAALAIPGRQEIRQGRDALSLCDIADPAHDAGKCHEDERRAKIDGQIVPPALRRSANRAEIGPGGTVDGQCQRIDERMLDKARPRGLPVALPGDQEQSKHVERRCAQDQPDRHEHLSMRLPPAYTS